MMKHVVYWFLLCLSVVAIPGISKSETPEKQEEGLYAQLVRGVVRIEEHESICTPGREWAIEKDFPIGSAFFVHDRITDKDGKEAHRYYIVTARHVVEGQAELFARVQAGPGTKDTFFLRLPADLWVFHPAPVPQGSFPIDVAVMMIPPTPFLKAFLHCTADDNPNGCGIDENTKKPIVNQVGEPPNVMERAIFFGFPEREVARRSVEPLARAGVIAYTAENPDLKIGVRPFLDNLAFLVDAPSFPGNSGGPVIREPLPLKGGIHLWGLVTGGSTIGRDYAIVTSVLRIHETLIHARSAAKFNSEAWYKQPPRLPIKCVPDAQD